MTPVSEHKAETHELFGTAAARAYLDHERRLRVCPKTSGGITKFSEHEPD